MTKTMTPDQTMTQDQTMTPEHFTRATRIGQEAISTAVRTWGESVQSALGMRTGNAEVHTPDHLIHAWFDIAAEVLEAQRELAEGLLAIGNPAIAAMTRATRQAAGAIQHSTDDASKEIDGAVGTAQRRRAERPPVRTNATAHKDR
jgi:hypothetical protein